MTSQGRWGRTSGSSLQTYIEMLVPNSTGGADFGSISDDVMSVRVSRGRKSENDTGQPGKCVVRVLNRDGSFEPGAGAEMWEADTTNTSTYANVPGRTINVQVSDVGAAIEALRPDRFFELNEQSGLVAYDRGARGGARQSYAQDGTYSGSSWTSTPTWQDGPHVLEADNKAAYFPGNDHWVSTSGDVPVETTMLARSYVAWIRPEGAVGNYVFSVDRQVFVRTAGENTSQFKVGVWSVVGDSADWVIEDNATAPVSVPANGWLMVALVYDSISENGWRLYVNGEFKWGGWSANPGARAAAPLRIGAPPSTTGFSQSATWQGRIKDVAVWYDYALSTEQIERLWEMSSQGRKLFSGYVTSWSQEFPDGTSAPGIVTLDCIDAAYTLVQQQIDPTPRSFTTRLNPSKLFTFDDDKLEDLQGGPCAQFLQGSVFVQRRADEPDELQRTAGSVTTGVSSAALYFNPSSAQMAQVLLPFPTDRGAPTAAMCWFKADGADRTGGPAGLEGRMVLLYSRKENGANWDHWFLGVNAKGVVVTRKETRSSSLYNGGSLVSSSEAVGGTYVCDGKWHHIAFLGSTVVVDGVVETAVSGTFMLPGASIYRVFGGTYQQYGIDELAIWYSGSVAAADCEPIYRSAADKWEGQTADERCDLLLDLADWPAGDRDLSTSTATRLGALKSGTVWTLLQQAATAEGGTLDCSGDGKVRLRSRHDRRRLGWMPINQDFTADVDLTQGGVGGYDDMQIITDDLLLYTAAQIDDVYYEDSQAIVHYGKRVFSQSPDIPSNDAAQRARGIVDRYKGFARRSDTVRFQIPTTHGGTGLLLDVNDYLLAVQRARDLRDVTTTTVYTFPSHVEQIEWQIDANKRATVTCQLSPADPLQETYFTIGTSTLETSNGDILGW